MPSPSELADNHAPSSERSKVSARGTEPAPYSWRAPSSESTATPSQRFRERQPTAVQSATPSPAGVPFWFGDSQRPLFGWYHSPIEHARAAVVLCNPIGHESLVLHRTYRRLAQHLATRGFATLRFDYDGTGDSAGCDEDEGRVRAWLESIQRASDEVKRLSGSSRVVLVGTRVGALLAATQAERVPVSGLILIAPPRSGKAWLREARVMQGIRERQLPPVPGTKPDQGIAGFLLDDTTRQELSELYPSKGAKAPALNALVVARDDLPSGELELVTYLKDLGVNAQLCATPGYAACSPEDPFKAVVPVQMFDAISGWLEDNYAKGHDAIDAEVVNRSLPEAFEASSQPDITTREHIVDVNGLFGVLAEPADLSGRSKTAVVLLNIGANYHIGSNRMYVVMARAWAAQGFRALRMDFSGMGDSKLGVAGKENDVYASRFMAEARSAVDFLIARGVTRVVLMGLCSGAYIAYHTGIADPRVSGVVLINPLTFHWTEGDSLEIRMKKSFGSTEQYKRRLFMAETWRRVLTGKVGVTALTAEASRRIKRRAMHEAKSILARVTGGIAEATDIERGFRRMSARGTSSLLVLGSEDGSRDVIEDHLGKDAASMKDVPGFVMEVWAGTDHTFTPLWAQRRLTRLVLDYLIKNSSEG